VLTQKSAETWEGIRQLSHSDEEREKLIALLEETNKHAVLYDIIEDALKKMTNK
jgi:hypothetical protein